MVLSNFPEEQLKSKLNELEKDLLENRALCKSLDDRLHQVETENKVQLHTFLYFIFLYFISSVSIHIPFAFHTLCNVHACKHHQAEAQINVQLLVIKRGLIS